MKSTPSRPDNAYGLWHERPDAINTDIGPSGPLCILVAGSRPSALRWVCERWRTAKCNDPLAAKTSSHRAEDTSGHRVAARPRARKHLTRRGQCRPTNRTMQSSARASDVLIRRHAWQGDNRVGMDRFGNAISAKRYERPTAASPYSVSSSCSSSSTSSVSRRCRRAEPNTIDGWRRRDCGGAWLAFPSSTIGTGKQ